MLPIQDSTIADVETNCFKVPPWEITWNNLKWHHISYMGLSENGMHLSNGNFDWTMIAKPRYKILGVPHFHMSPYWYYTLDMPIKTAELPRAWPLAMMWWAHPSRRRRSWKCGMTPNGKWGHAIEFWGYSIFIKNISTTQMKDVSYPVAWSETVRHVNPKAQAQSAQTSIQKICLFHCRFLLIDFTIWWSCHLLLGCECGRQFFPLSHLSTGPAADLFAACDGSSRDHGLPRNGRSPCACLNWGASAAFEYLWIISCIIED